jgi:predicted RNA-binding protein with TRAM domain
MSAYPEETQADQTQIPIRAGSWRHLTVSDLAVSNGNATVQGIVFFTKEPGDL